MFNSTDDHLSKDEKDFSEISTPRKTTEIVESTDTKPSTSASKETDPLLSSQKNDQWNSNIRKEKNLFTHSLD